tara:strand:+ start:2409 stop:2771 length:363 start_codon:yes stop_codon:yes gene_type:complete
MSEMHYDHDQSERDEYNQSVKNLRKGCFNSLKIFAVVVVILALCMWLFSGCEAMKSAAEPPISEAFGTVISIDGDGVLVAFEVINKDKGSQSSNWFYCPRHRFRKGDTYPDPSKYQPIKP